jgi:carbon monoxide dehydrogenase subunit G
MKVELDRTFPLPVPAGVSWEFLQNIEAVAGCMPGARITERLPSGGYKGTVTVRAGPVTMSFRGDVDVRDIDPAARSLRLLGKGSDGTGTSGASLDLAARIEAVGEGASALVGRSEVAMSGKAAAFGGRMMTSIADQVLNQFAANFAREVAAFAARSAGSNGAAPAAPAVPAQGPPAASPALSPAGRELNGLALLWAVVKDWLRGLISKKAA